MDLSTIISLGAMLVALFGLFMSGRKDTRTDAAATAIIQTKLDSLIGGVDDIRVEMRSIQATMVNHGERLARVEARAQSNTHRLDALEGKKAATNKGGKRNVESGSERMAEGCFDQGS